MYYFVFICAIFALIMAEKNIKRKDKRQDKILHIRPKAANSDMKDRIELIANELGRSANSVGERVLLDYLEKPWPLDFTKTN